MSYFAEPNFIIYDEWFDDDLEKKKLNFRNKKIKNTSKIHEFFYEQSNYIIGASENNMQFDIKTNKKELIINNDFNKISDNYYSVPIKKSSFLKNLEKNNIKFSNTKKLFFSLSIICFILFFGYVIFVNSQYKKNESKISTNFYLQEKQF